LAKSYADIKRQIAKLQEEAQALREREIQDVVGRIREAIAHYGLTPEELFGTASGRKGTEKTKVAGNAAKPKGTSKAKGRKVAIKFEDGDGNTWTGRGNKPRWLVAALAEGKSLDDFKV
jgi:DNA-binding protein H-NS